MKKSTVLLMAGIGILALVFGALPPSVQAADPFPFTASVFTNLDYGIYWFGYNYANQKAVAGKSNPYFDPNKPTMIYVHGWENGTTPNMMREAFDYTGSGAPKMYFAEEWLLRGWNVGVFYWNQFSDEREVKDAEAKIWSVAGPKKMRWRSADGQYHANGPSSCASVLFYNAYKSAMANYKGSEIRIVGHSLGNQMAVAMTKLTLDGVNRKEIPARLLPDRVALLDPFYSNYGKSYLNGQWTGAVVRGYAKTLISRGVLFEVYKTSPASGAFLVGDANTGLMKICAYTELKPWYFSAIALANKHIAAVWHYLWSYSFDPPPIKRSYDDGASASASDDRIAELMASPKKLVHNLGVWTKTPEDDRMAYANK